MMIMEVSVDLLVTEMCINISSSSNVVIYQPKQLHNKFDPKERVYEGSASLTEMKTWVNDNMYVFQVVIGY